MTLSLTLEQLFRLFEETTRAFFPLQVLAGLLGIAALFFAIRRRGASSRVIFGVLAFFWLWSGAVFFPFYFAPIFTPAYVFAVLFLIQGGIFVVHTIKPSRTFAFRGDLGGIVALLCVAYAIIGYPLLGLLFGRSVGQTPPFGLAPCPVVIFTFGMLLLMEGRVPRRLLAIPLLWAFSGVVPVCIGFFEDIGLIAAGALATALILRRERRAAVR